MREALVRIAGNLSSAKEKEWQGAIDTFLTSPLTAEAKRNVDELKKRYLQDMEVKESIEELKNSFENVEGAVREDIVIISSAGTELNLNTAVFVGTLRIRSILQFWLRLFKRWIALSAG